jgi:hypothetical protein
LVLIYWIEAQITMSRTQWGSETWANLSMEIRILREIIPLYWNR